MHVDCIGMRAISMGSILAHNIGCAIRHPTISNAAVCELGSLHYSYSTKLSRSKSHIFIFMGVGKWVWKCYYCDQTIGANYSPECATLWATGRQPQYPQLGDCGSCSKTSQSWQCWQGPTPHSPSWCPGLMPSLARYACWASASVQLADAPYTDYTFCCYLSLSLMHNRFWEVRTAAVLGRECMGLNVFNFHNEIILNELSKLESSRNFWNLIAGFHQFFYVQLQDIL